MLAMNVGDRNGHRVVFRSRDGMRIALGRAKVGIARVGRSFGYCLHLLSREGDATLGLYARRKVVVAPTNYVLHGRCF